MVVRTHRCAAAAFDGLRGGPGRVRACGRPAGGETMAKPRYAATERAAGQLYGDERFSDGANAEFWLTDLLHPHGMASQKGRAVLR